MLEAGQMHPLGQSRGNQNVGEWRVSIRTMRPVTLPMVHAEARASARPRVGSQPPSTNWSVPETRLTLKKSASLATAGVTYSSLS